MNIVIVGGGTAGWLTALSLHDKHDVTLVESEIPTIGVGESTTDRLVEWLVKHNIDLPEFIEQTNGTVKLASRFVNFGEQSFFHPFNAKDDSEFINVSQWAYHNEESVQSLSEFYKHCNDRTVPTDLNGIAVHWDNVAVPNYLRKKLEHKILIINDTVKKVHFDKKSISKLELNYCTIEADLYIDCTGFHKMLIGNDNFESWNQPGQVDSAVVWQEDYETFSPYTQLDAMDYGWAWTIHTKNRAGRGYVFDSSYIDATQAMAEAGKENCRVTTFEPGVQKQMLSKNVVAIGLSAHFVEPMEATNIEFATKQLDLLVKVLDDKITREEFNNTLYNTAHEIRAFIKLHYINNHNNKTAFWKNQKYSSWFKDSYRELVQKSNLSYVTENNWQWYDLFSWCCILQGIDVKPNSKIDDPALLAKYQLATV